MSTNSLPGAPRAVPLSMTLRDLIGEYEVIASNSAGWGKGCTMAEATASCRKSTRRSPNMFTLVPKGTILECTGINYPIGAKFVVTKL